MSFVSHIEKIAEVYHLEVEWTLWYHANPNEDTRWTTPGTEPVLLPELPPTFVTPAHPRAEDLLL